MLENFKTQYQINYERFKTKYPKFFKNDTAAASADQIMLTVVALVVGIYTLAFVLPNAMQALGNMTNTSENSTINFWPAGTANFIIPIGIFVMVAILILFARSALGATK